MPDRLLKCLVALGSGGHKAAYRDLFFNLGIELSGLDWAAPVGQDTAENLREIAKSCDFAFAFLPDHWSSLQVTFELGIASAFRKPIFLVTTNESLVPGALASSTIVVAEPHDISAIEFQLRYFIRNIRRSSFSLNHVPSTTAVFEEHPVAVDDLRSRVQPMMSLAQGESLVADVLRRAGLSVEEQPKLQRATSLGPANYRPDMIAWLRQPIWGTRPQLIIEVKGAAWNANPGLVNSAILQIGSYMRTSSIGAGLIVTLRAQDRDPMPLMSYMTKDGIVFRTSVFHLMFLVEHGFLLRELASSRNQALNAAR